MSELSRYFNAEILPAIRSSYGTRDVTFPTASVTRYTETGMPITKHGVKIVGMNFCGPGWIAKAALRQLQVVFGKEGFVPEEAYHAEEAMRQAEMARYYSNAADEFAAAFDDGYLLMDSITTKELKIPTRYGKVISSRTVRVNVPGIGDGSKKRFELPKAILPADVQAICDSFSDQYLAHEDSDFSSYYTHFGAVFSREVDIKHGRVLASIPVSTLETAIAFGSEIVSVTVISADAGSTSIYLPTLDAARHFFHLDDARAVKIRVRASYGAMSPQGIINLCNVVASCIKRKAGIPAEIHNALGMSEEMWRRLRTNLYALSGDWPLGLSDHPTDSGQILRLNLYAIRDFFCEQDTLPDASSMSRVFPSLLTKYMVSPSGLQIHKRTLPAKIGKLRFMYRTADKSRFDVEIDSAVTEYPICTFPGVSGLYADITFNFWSGPRGTLCKGIPNPERGSVTVQFEDCINRELALYLAPLEYLAPYSVFPIGANFAVRDEHLSFCSPDINSTFYNHERCKFWEDGLKTFNTSHSTCMIHYPLNPAVYKDCQPCVGCIGWVYFASVLHSATIPFKPDKSFFVFQSQLQNWIFQESFRAHLRIAFQITTIEAESIVSLKRSFFSGFY